MCAKIKQEAKNPLILRCHRLMEAFAKSDDERDFYIDRQEGFLVYVDLDKPQEELDSLYQELEQNGDRYCGIPKLSFYETKKIMEGFVNEKVYDIDTKEKLLDIIQSKEARENFLEFIYDHHSEQEKWQQFYQERSRIRIIEWLRQNHFHFVFEEDLDLPRQLIEKLKQSLFQSKVGKDILNARKSLAMKAKTYYSNEALNPRPKRGRPPKQAVKQEFEPQVTVDIYTTVTSSVRPFLFSPDLNISSPFSIFSSKFDSEEEVLSNRRQLDPEMDGPLQQKLAAIRSFSSKWTDSSSKAENNPYAIDTNFNDDDDDDDDDEDFKGSKKPQKKSTLSKSKPAPVSTKAKAIATKTKKNNSSATKNALKKPASVAKKSTKVEKPKRIMPKIPPVKGTDSKPKKLIKK